MLNDFEPLIFGLTDFLGESLYFSDKLFEIIAAYVFDLVFGHLPFQMLQFAEDIVASPDHRVELPSQLRLLWVHIHDLDLKI